jgi:hypothetical protein
MNKEEAFKEWQNDILKLKQCPCECGHKDPLLVCDECGCEELYEFWER